MKRKALFKKLLAMGLAVTFALSTVTGAFATEDVGTELTTEAVTETETDTEAVTEGTTESATETVTEAVSEAAEVMEYSVETQDLKAAGTKTLNVNYYCSEIGAAVGTGTVTVDADAEYVSASALTDIPVGYRLKTQDNISVFEGNDWIFVEVELATKEVGVNYWDAENGVHVIDGSVTVDKEAEYVDVSALTDVPEGYELVTKDLVQINDNWIYVEVKPVSATKEVGVNYWDAENGVHVIDGSVTVDKEAGYVDVSVLTDVPEGYELVTKDLVQINDNWIYVEVKPVSSTKEVGVNYWDAENEVHVVDGSVTVDKEAEYVDVSALTDVPEGYELVTNGPVQINDNWIYVEVKPVSTTKEVKVNYWDVIKNEQAREGIVIVASDATTVDTSVLTDVPEGYELVNPGEIRDIMDGWIYVEVRPAEKVVGVNYWDIVNNKQAGEGKITVAADAAIVNTTALTDVPEGYELAILGDVFINDNWIYVEVRPVAKTQTVGVNYWDVENEKQAYEGSITVDADAVYVNTTTLADVPQGYELVELGDVMIRDGWIYVEVRPVAKTQTVGVNYWDVENNKQAGEGSITVSADAVYVNTTTLTDVPEGYELVELGDVMIRDGWIYVEVRAESTKTVGVNYYSFEEGRQIAESSVEVAADATYVNTSLLTDVPQGYELVLVGDLQINDGWIFAEVRKAAATKTVGVNYYSFEEGRQIAESSVEVAADATYVNTSLLTDVPEGYELVLVGDLQINDGWIFAEVRKAVTTKTVEVKYYVEDEDRYIDGQPVTVDKDATYVNTSILTDVPEGYVVAEVGDMPIRDGQIIVKIRDAVTTKEVAVKYHIEAEDRYINGQPVKVDKDATYVNTSAFKDVPQGYELVLLGDLPIENDTVIVELRAKKLDVYFVIDDAGKGSFADYEGLTVSFTDLDTAAGAVCSVPSVKAAEGYVFAGWTDSTGAILLDASQTSLTVEPGMGTYLEGADNGMLVLTAQFTAAPTESETTEPEESETTAPEESETTVPEESETTAPEESESDEPDTEESETTEPEETEDLDEEETDEDDTEKPAGNSGDSNSSGTDASQTSNDGSVKTGDETPIALYMAVMLMAGAVIAAVLIKARRTRTY